MKLKSTRHRKTRSLQTKLKPVVAAVSSLLISGCIVEESQQKSHTNTNATPMVVMDIGIAAVKNPELPPEGDNLLDITEVLTINEKYSSIALFNESQALRDLRGETVKPTGAKALSAGFSDAHCSDYSPMLFEQEHSGLTISARLDSQLCSNADITLNILGEFIDDSHLTNTFTGDLDVSISYEGLFNNPDISLLDKTRTLPARYLKLMNRPYPVFLRIEPTYSIRVDGAVSAGARGNVSYPVDVEIISRIDFEGYDITSSMTNNITPLEPSISFQAGATANLTIDSDLSLSFNWDVSRTDVSADLYYDALIYASGFNGDPAKFEARMNLCWDITESTSFNILNYAVYTADTNVYSSSCAVNPARIGTDLEWTFFWDLTELFDWAPQTPRGLVLSNVTGVVRSEWFDVSNANSYSLTIECDDFTDTAETSESQYTFEPPCYDVPIEVMVKANNSHGSSDFSEIETIKINSITDPVLPPPDIGDDSGDSGGSDGDTGTDGGSDDNGIVQPPNIPSLALKQFDSLDELNNARCDYDLDGITSTYNLVYVPYYIDEVGDVSSDEYKSLVLSTKSISDNDSAPFAYQFVARDRVRVSLPGSDRPIVLCYDMDDIDDQQYQVTNIESDIRHSRDGSDDEPELTCERLGYREMDEFCIALAAVLEDDDKPVAVISELGIEDEDGAYIQLEKKHIRDVLDIDHIKFRLNDERYELLMYIEDYDSSSRRSEIEAWVGYPDDDMSISSYTIDPRDIGDPVAEFIFAYESSGDIKDATVLELDGPEGEYIDDYADIDRLAPGVYKLSIDTRNWHRNGDINIFVLVETNKGRDYILEFVVEM